MAMTRRTFVGASVFAALGAVAGRALGRVDASVAAAAPTLRPPASGSSAARCSRCGSAGHTALHGACPEGAETTQALQASARRLAARPAAGGGRTAGPGAGRAGA